MSEYSQWEYKELTETKLNLLKKLSDMNKEHKEFDEDELEKTYLILKSLHYIHKCKHHMKESVEEEHKGQ